MPCNWNILTNNVETLLERYEREVAAYEELMQNTEDNDNNLEEEDNATN